MRLFSTYWLGIIWILLIIGLAVQPTSALADELRDPPAAVQDNPAPAAGSSLADQAFAAYGEGRYGEARRLAEEALAKERPGDYHLNMLVVNTLEREKAWPEVEARLTAVLAGHPDDAYALASRGFARLNRGDRAGAEDDFQKALKNNPDAALEANVRAALKQIDQERGSTSRPVAETAPPAAGPSLSDQAFAAYSEGRYGEARRLAEEALAKERPGDYNLNMLVVNILEREKAWPEVEARLTAVLADHPNDVYALSSRGFARLNQMRRAAAAEDFNLALLQKPEGETAANIRAALGQIRQANAQEKSAARQAKASAAVSKASDRLMGIQKLIFEKQYDQAARQLKQVGERDLSPRNKGLRLYLQGELLWHEEQFDQAVPLFREAQSLLPDNFYQAQIWSRLADYERSRDHAETAMEYVRKSVDMMPGSEVYNLQAAYLFLHFQQDAEAARYFETALDIKKTVPEEQAFIYMDLSYAYKRLGDNDRQQDRLERYIDLQDSLVAKQSPKEKLSVESLYIARREHADLVREFGWYSGNYFNRYGNGDHAFQIINDVYWQPWFNNGRSVQLYGQVVATLDSRYTNSYYDYWTEQTYDSDTNYYFGDSVYATAGIRFDPSVDHNLILTLEKIFKIGSKTRDDLRGRIGYSWDTGLELEPYEPDWLYTTFFNELAHSFQHNDTTYVGEARLGRSYRLDCINDRLVVSPHLVTVWGYGGKDVDAGERWSLEAGAGVHFRQWYREDKYNAPQSYADVIMQYRFGLSHNRENVFTVTLFNSF